MGTTAQADQPQDVIRPMLATLGDPPDGDGWAGEFKWDGYRGIAYANGHNVRVLSRNDVDLVDEFRELRILPDLLEGRSAVLDGEIVALGADQRPDFGLLQQLRSRSGVGLRTQRPRIAYYVFDLLHLDGRSLLSTPYEARRALLTGLNLPGNHPVQVPPTFPDTDPASLLQVAAEYGLEGIVAKRLGSRYEPGRRSPSWIKVPLRHTQEVVICGWKPGQGRRANTIGSLLLGVYEDGRLTFAGHVGTGFTDTVLFGLRRQLEGLERPTSPFDSDVPREYARHARWVSPELVGDVHYRQWTSDGRLRHPAWRGMRPDKNPADVVRGPGT
jgi:bifunctional non-homologous end joining protein LigD